MGAKESKILFDVAMRESFLSEKLLNVVIFGIYPRKSGSRDFCRSHRLKVVNGNYVIAINHRDIKIYIQYRVDLRCREIIG